MTKSLTEFIDELMTATLILGIVFVLGIIVCFAFINFIEGKRKAKRKKLISEIDEQAEKRRQELIERHRAEKQKIKIIIDSENPEEGIADLLNDLTGDE